MKKIGDMNREELAAYVCSHLDKNGVEVTLTGGSCVSIYSNNRYVSMDLDFIEKMTVRRKELAAYLMEIGFVEENRYFKHPNTELFIEFPPGPLAVGSEPIIDTVILKFDTGFLKLISPTECVKDRLASYYIWNDLQCLDQALMVAEQNDINLREVKRWSKVEGEEDKFKIFLSKLEMLVRN